MNTLENKQQTYATRVFWLAFQTSFIFAIPAVVGVFAGKSLDKWFDTGSIATMIILLITFIFSWVLVLIKYRALAHSRKTDNNLK